MTQSSGMYILAVESSTGNAQNSDLLIEYSYYFWSRIENIPKWTNVE